MSDDYFSLSGVLQGLVGGRWDPVNRIDHEFRTIITPLANAVHIMVTYRRLILQLVPHETPIERRRQAIQTIVADDSLNIPAHLRQALANIEFPNFMA